MYQIFKESMNARSKATGILGALFVCLSVFQYERVIELHDPVYDDLYKLEGLCREHEAATQALATRGSMTAEMAAIADKLVQIGYASDLASNFRIIEWLCFFNMSFLAQHVVSLIYTQRMGRFYDFPSVLHLTDLILLVLSIIIINWIQSELFANMDSSLSDVDAQYQVLLNYIR